MKKSFLSLAALCAFALSAVAAPTDYQVTGPIVSMTDSTIVVQKGKESWELAKDPSMKAKDGSELRVGDKVEIHYTMTAKSIERKESTKKTKPPTDTKKKAAATPAPTAAPTAAPSATPTPRS